MSEDEEPAPRPANEGRSRNSSGKRTATPAADDDTSSSQQGSSSKRHNSSESVSASILQSTLATAISTIMTHNNSGSAMQMEWKRAEEAVAECKRLEAVVREMEKKKVMVWFIF